MEKSEFPKNNKGAGFGKSKGPELDSESFGKPKGPVKSSPISGLSAKAFGIIKFILGLCLLSFVYSSTISFLGEFQVADLVWRKFFWSGVIAFLIVYLFVFEPAIIYQKGHRMLEIVFSFFAPLVKVAPYVIPIYTIIIAILYSIVATFSSSVKTLHTLVFLFGFTLGLHLVYSAKTLRTKQGDFLKGNYIFGFSFVYVINIFIAAFCVNLIFEKFSLVNFCNNSYQIATGIYTSIFKQLFVPPG